MLRKMGEEDEIPNVLSVGALLANPIVLEDARTRSIGLWGWGRPRAAQDMIWAVPRGLDPAHACCYRPREADWRKLKPSYIFSHMSTHFLRN